MGICFHTKQPPLEGSYEEVLAASRPANPREAKKFGINLYRGRFNCYIRIITKDVILPPLYGARSVATFLIPSNGPTVTLADWQRKTGHGYVILENPEEMEWFAKKVWNTVAVAHERYAVIAGDTEYLKILEEARQRSIVRNQR